MLRRQQKEEQTPLSLSAPSTAPVEQQSGEEAPSQASLENVAPFRIGRRRRLRRALLGLDPNREFTLEEVMGILEVETRKRQRRRTWIIAGMVSYVGLMLFLALLHWVLHRRFDPQIFNFMGSMGGVFGATAAFSRTHKAAAQRISEFQDVRAVGHLATAMEIQDKGTRRIVEDALTRLLPEMRASDAGLLNAEQRENLYRGLRRKNPPLVLAILTALEQVGDSKAIPYVEKLEKNLLEQQAEAKKLARLQPAEIDQQLQAARECLQFLQDHVQQEQARQTLLRASSAAQVAPDSLLRPAAETFEQDTASLLRAAGPADTAD